MCVGASMEWCCKNYNSAHKKEETKVSPEFYFSACVYNDNFTVCFSFNMFDIFSGQKLSFIVASVSGLVVLQMHSQDSKSNSFVIRDYGILC